MKTFNLVANMSRYRIHNVALVICLMMSMLLFNACDSRLPQAGPEYTFSSIDTSRSFIRLLFAGDAMQHDRQLEWAYDSVSRQYCYDNNFYYLRSYIADADLAFVNLETTLPGCDYAGYPKFRTPDTYLEALSDAGFDVFTLANNHILDSGKKGMKRTLERLGNRPHCGAYMDTLQRRLEYPLILNIDDLKIAFFNATYGTNQLVPEPNTCVNYIETEQLLLDMEASLEDTTIDLRVISIHWGDEYQLYHNPLQLGVAQWLADLGFDLIIGGHPHVVQDQEILTASDGRRVPVVYSLGNLISNQRRLHCNGGLMVTVDIDRLSHKIMRLDYIPVYVHMGEFGPQTDYFCLPATDYIEGKLPYTIESDSLQEDCMIFYNNAITRMGEPLILQE